MHGHKYVGLDVDQATIVACVMNEKGQVEMHSVLETKPEAIRQFIRSLKGTIHVAFEEGPQASWLYDLIRPLVREVVVCDPRHNKLVQSGNKGDFPDSWKLARLLRLGELRPVYHGERSQRGLKELVAGYERLSSDRTRVKSRLKAVYRSQGILSRGKAVYSKGARDKWIPKLGAEALQLRAVSLYRQLDFFTELKQEAKQAMQTEARRHPAYELLLSVPGLGPVRSAQTLATVATPGRFRTKRQLWPYCGFGVTTHMSSEYHFVDGQWRRRKKPVQTRGLNKNFNRRLKAVFKGAAVSAIKKEPFKQYHKRLIDKGIRPEMALLTVARKIAAITLAVWKKGEPFDPDRVLTQQ